MFSHLKKKQNSAHYTNQKTILMISSEHLASYFYALGLSATMSMPIPDFSGCFVPTFEPVCNMLVIVLELMVNFCTQLFDSWNSVQHIRHSPRDFDEWL